MEHRELRILSMDFRRVSSNFLNSTRDTSDVAMERFINFIDSNRFISKIIHDAIAGIDCDFKECFDIESYNWRELKIPLDENEHIKVQYDYLKYILNETNGGVLGEALNFCRSSKKYDEIIQAFVSDCFKPLIDYINDAISKEMIIIEDEMRMLQNITQNIQTVNGTVIQQGQGTVQSTNTTNTTSDDLIALISKLSASLDDIDAIPDDEKDSVKDDLESIEEQIKSASPKKSRLNKALNGVKNFVCKFGESILVPVAIDKMQNVNWTDLIQQLEHFIAHIH